MKAIEILNMKKYEESMRRKNVCAYARVSSFRDSQLTSFDLQVKYYTELIRQNDDYNFVGVFADHGKTGTSIHYRTEFQNMIELAKLGSVDLIITKSISRFARNTIDCLSTISVLKEYGTEVWFENENISSMDPKIEFVISVIAGIAQEESRSNSENVKWSLKKRHSNGTLPPSTSKLLGYSKDNNGQIVINKKEAKIVKNIFNMYISGKSLNSIAQHLNTIGLRTKTGKVKYYEYSISRILDNEKYTGNALLQKTHVREVGSKVKIRSEDVLPQYYVNNSHPAIIDQEMYDQVQIIKNERILKYNKTLSKRELNQSIRKAKYAEKITCPYCGKNYIHRINRKGKDNQTTFLTCSSNKNRKLCRNETIKTALFDNIQRNLIDVILKNEKEFINSLSKALSKHPERMCLQNKIKQTEGEILQLNARLSSIIINDDDYDIKIRQNLLSKIDLHELNLVVMKNSLLTKYNHNSIISHMKKFMKSMKSNKQSSFIPFTKIVIQDRDNINFIIDPYNSLDDLFTTIIFESKTPYLIRKTTHTNNSRLIIK